MSLVLLATILGTSWFSGNGLVAAHGSHQQLMQYQRSTTDIYVDQNGRPLPPNYSMQQLTPQNYKMQQSMPQSYPSQQPTPQNYLSQQSMSQNYPMQQSMPQNYPMQQSMPQKYPMQQSMPQYYPMQQSMLQNYLLPQPMPQNYPMPQPMSLPYAMPYLNRYFEYAPNGIPLYGYGPNRYPFNGNLVTAQPLYEFYVCGTIDNLGQKLSPSNPAHTDAGAKTPVPMQPASTSGYPGSSKDKSSPSTSLKNLGSVNTQTSSLPVSTERNINDHTVYSQADDTLTEDNSTTSVPPTQP